MSADVLRQAAALMRERAEAATPGPWEPYQNIHAETAACEVGRGGFGVVALPATGRRDYGKANIEHIASWHPAVALAVADWLDSEADEHERYVSQAIKNNSVRLAYANSRADHALTVARAYLGTDA